jgi:predicted lipoprotein with Yx(FWY)xxD motif
MFVPQEAKMEGVIRRDTQRGKGGLNRKHFNVTCLASLAAGAVGLGALAGMAAPAVASTKAAPVEVKMATVPKYGKILVTSAGLALYYDTANKPGKWACTGGCLTAWPPLVLAKGQTRVMAGPGVTGLSTVKSPSGTQVTWDGKALYTFIRDSKSTVTGQGYQKVWYVAQPKAAASSSSSSSGSSWA